LAVIVGAVGTGLTVTTIELDIADVQPLLVTVQVYVPPADAV
jgi:hypothetical protein